MDVTTSSIPQTIQETEQEDTLPNEDSQLPQLPTTKFEQMMPEVLTQSWEHAIQGSTKEFIDSLLSKYPERQQVEKRVSVVNTFKRGPTMFVSKRLPSEEDEQIELKEDIHTLKAEKVES